MPDEDHSRWPHWEEMCGPRAERDRDRNSGLPVELQPLARQYFEAREACCKAISQKYRYKATGQQDPLLKLTARVEELKASCAALEDELRSAMIEQRVREFAPENQDRARALIVEQHEAIIAALSEVLGSDSTFSVEAHEQRKQQVAKISVAYND